MSPPDAQSRNVTYLRRMQSSQRRSRASIEFSVKSNNSRDALSAPGYVFCFDYFRLLLLLFSVDNVLQLSLLMFDRDLAVAFLTDLDVRPSHGIRPDAWF